MSQFYKQQIGVTLTIIVKGTYEALQLNILSGI